MLAVIYVQVYILNSTRQIKAASTVHYHLLSINACNVLIIVLSTLRHVLIALILLMKTIVLSVQASISMLQLKNVCFALKASSHKFPLVVTVALPGQAFIIFVLKILIVKFLTARTALIPVAVQSVI